MRVTYQKLPLAERTPQCNLIKVYNSLKVTERENRTSQMRTVGGRSRRWDYQWEQAARRSMFGPSIV